MKKNKRLEERRKTIPEDVKIYVDMAFNLADQIDIILKKQGKSQRELAEQLGKSESEISKWLSGEHNLTLRSLAKLQAELGEPLILFPKDLEEKIDSKVQVFVFSGDASTLTAIKCEPKNNDNRNAEGNSFKLFSPASNSTTLELDLTSTLN